MMRWGLAFFGALLFAAQLRAQERRPVLLEGEVGLERFNDASVRSVFRTGGSARLGPAFQFADEGRLRLRPQLGMKLFANQIDEHVTEQLLFVKLGAQASYDLFYVGQTTFFPYISTEYNWASNFDAESYGDEDTSFSERYLHGNGFSYELGLRVQVRTWYVKMGYEHFNPNMRIRDTIREEDQSSGYDTPRSYPFRFDALNISVGFSILP